MKTLIQPFRKLQSQQGLTLVEMMIAMTLSLLLLAGIAIIMRGSKTSYDTQNDASRIQENARYALDFITKDLRMTGYWGCKGNPPLDPNNTLNINPPIGGRDDVQVSTGLVADMLRVAYVDMNQNAFAIMHCPPYTAYRDLLQSPLYGYGALADYEAICPPKQPDVLAFNTAAAQTPLEEGEGTSGSPLDFANFPDQAIMINGALNVGDIVVAADCRGSDAYTVAAYDETAGTLQLNSIIDGTEGLLDTYNNQAQSYDAFLRPLRIWRYYVAEVTRGERTYNALCRDSERLNSATNCPEANELIEGVENLQIRYGILNNNDGSVQYLTASEVGNSWDRVTSVRLTLLMQSVEQRHNRDADNNIYNLDEAAPNDAYGPIGDHRLRRVFTTTVNLRN